MGSPEILVLDDFFPNLLTGFRVAEYNALLSAFPRMGVLSANPEFAQHHAAYASLYPQHAGRVLPFEPQALRDCRLAYLNFLNNAVMFLPHLQEHQTPFVLTLYPGGGFGLRDAQSDAKLLQVLGSGLLQSVIVTVPVTRDYVLDFMRRHGLPSKPVHLVRGVVVNPGYFDSLRDGIGASDETPIRICFVAEKYMSAGRNKGYPDFVEAAKSLRRGGAGAGLPLEFHIVGSFGPDDWDAAELGECIHFHGRLETGELRQFLSGMNLLISPNLPGLLHPGNFDGFPTGSAVEASLCGVALMVTDPLQQNPGYTTNISYLPIPIGNEEAMASLAPAIFAACRKILEGPHPRRYLRQIGLAGRQVSEKLYAPSYQLGLRQALLEAHLRGGFRGEPSFS